MRFKSLAIMIASLWSVGCASKQTPALLDQTRTEPCQEELHANIQELVGAKKLTILENVFSKESYVIVTNRPKGVILHPSMQAEKKLFLYRKGEELYIGLLDADETILKEKALKFCK